MRTPPASDPSAFRARQRRALAGMTTTYVLTTLGWLVPGLFVLVGVGQMIVRGEVDPVPVLAVVAWAGVAQYGHFVFRAMIVPLRRRPGRDSTGWGYLASRGGHAMVCATGLGCTVLWAITVLLYVGLDGAWAAVGWTAVAALGGLTLISGIRGLAGRAGLAPRAWRTHPDDALAGADEQP